jgi:hypothetical protein
MIISNVIKLAKMKTSKDCAYSFLLLNFSGGASNTQEKHRCFSLFTLYNYNLYIYEIYILPEYLSYILLGSVLTFLLPLIISDTC